MASSPVTVDPVAGGSLIDWDDSFAFLLGNEVSGDRQWQGRLRLVAIHNRALTQCNRSCRTSKQALVRNSFYCLTSVITAAFRTPTSCCEVSQFDNYSYLFNDPMFIILDANAYSQTIFR